MAIHCLSGSCPKPALVANRMSGCPLCVVIHCRALVAPCGRTATLIASLATLELGSWPVLNYMRPSAL